MGMDVKIQPITDFIYIPNPVYMLKSSATIKSFGNICTLYIFIATSIASLVASSALRAFIASPIT